ncbi:efflux RND transporter periplasmic adaptor subunit [Engelhardtia mirabilis]|uniref:Efflux pump periplasmic linker BepF n=1 Tax=Engelhardtia mirabilis TaxID=2528011 RepID=A0A518BIT6_9BACT|nr:Efflux pump periplasmic linker BepF [Planctomycetes bacterium Pla133]QDV01202.1 Efflux pump periplasmic linker BepF [Planctomycetes bacterium Pla86]
MSERDVSIEPATETRGRSSLRLVLVVAAGAMALGAAAWGAVTYAGSDDGESGGIRAVPERNNALPVNAVRVTPVDGYERRRTFAGEVRARRASDLAFERSARIATLAVHEGQRLSAGDLIAALDVRDVEARRAAVAARRDAAQAQLDELRAGPRTERIDAAAARVDELEQRLELARIVEGRRRDLVASEAISAEELDAARLDAAALGASVAMARAELAELETGTRPEQLSAQEARVAELDAELVGIDVDLDRSRIEAPFDGVVERVLAEVGSVAAPAAPVVTLVEAVNLEAWIGLPTEVAAELTAGDRRELRIGERSFEGEFIACLPGVDATTRTRTAVLRLADVELGAVVPGQLAELVTVERVPLEGLWLSAEGLVNARRGLWAAYVLTPLAAGDDAGVDGATHRVERRELESLATDGARVLVRGDLAPGQLVLADGAQRVTAGQAVRLAAEVEVQR